MANLSPGDRDIIEKYPLDSPLDHLHDMLRETEGCCHLSDNDSSQKIQKSVSRLLLALMGQTTAYNLRSKVTSQNVASELSILFGRVQNGSFDYKYYRALVRLVVQKAPDVNIWSAVFDLINTLTRVTPPTSIAPSYDGTPIARSSASYQGNEQTKKLLEEALFWEVKDCTYRNVEGFFEKYFEGKRWSRQSKEIYKAVKRHHIDGRWTDFPDPPDQDAVWEWLSRVQDKHFSQFRGVFYATKRTSDLTGGEAKRQLDLFMKGRSDEAEIKHNWKDVRVIGELKQSEWPFKDILLQLSRYMRDAFTAQPTRRFIHGFFLHGTTMELWVFDRSGPYSSGEFDIHAEPEKFIRAIAGYALMSDEELGLDTFLQQEDGGLFISVTEDVSEKEQRLRLEREPFVKQRAIVCRGTNCYRTHDQASVVKLSWTSDKRKPEAELLRLAREKGVKGIAGLLGYHRITSIEELRKGLTFSKPHPFRLTSLSSSFSSSQSAPGFPRSLGAFRDFSIDEAVLGKRKSDDDAAAKPTKKSRSNSQRSKLSQEYEINQAHKAQQPIQKEQVSLYASSNGPFENRLFCCLVISPAGRALRELESIPELLTVLRDAIKAHRSLLCDGEILHRDISENNIIITDPKQADGFVGILIDLDLAKLLHSERSGARHQTGTMEFMAIQVLRRAAHTYRHDLESFFYVLLWICARRAWGMELGHRWEHRPKKSRLKKWYTGSFDDIADSKEHHMGVNGFEGLLLEFPPAFDHVKPLCRKIRAILFPLLEDGGLNIGTPSSPPEKLYDAITEAFDEAISQT